jgi:signal peptidase I
MTVQDEANQRRVRPWIAALLTILGLGLGLYYARRTRAAIWLVVLATLVGIALGCAVIGYALYTKSAPTYLFNQNGVSWLDAISWALTVVIAIAVWIVVARRQYVPKAGPARLLGYLAIWLLPLLFSLSAAMGVRFAAFQPYRIPSGAMQPTLMVGDYVIVSKSSYGYSRFSIAPFESLAPHGRWRARQPVRGDLVVFRPVSEPERDFVKRLVGLPGDRIQMIDGVLHINGAAVAREALGEQRFSTEGVPFTAQAVRETLPNGVSYVTLDRGATELDNTRVYTVPQGSYFFMGDDRDNSADSRVPSVVGYVPFENLIGRVDHILSGPGGR